MHFLVYGVEFPGELSAKSGSLQGKSSKKLQG